MPSGHPCVQAKLKPVEPSLAICSIQQYVSNFDVVQHRLYLENWMLRENGRLQVRVKM